MARPVEYDLKKVLNKSMDLFWEKGYENVSMADLVDYTGLNRRTMYSLFKDKDGIFKESLKNYYKIRSLKRIKILKNNPGKKGIELFFNNFNFSNDFNGCFFNNCIGKKEFLKKDIFEIPQNYFIELRFQIEKNLKQALELKEFNGNIKETSSLLMIVIHGFNIYGMYNHSKEEGQQIIKNILKIIK